MESEESFPALLRHCGLSSRNRPQHARSLTEKVFVGWVQPTNCQDNPVGCTHPTNVILAFWDGLSVTYLPNGR